MFAGNRWKKLIIAAIFAVTGACLLAQFSQVMVYYDDYGYYSLSYGVESFHSGHEFTFGELFRFLNAHYVGANGRLLYFGLWLTLYKIGGLAGVQIGAALIVLCVLFLVWKMALHGKQLGGVISALTVCSLYGLLSVTIHRQGTYWFAAFFHYVASVVPFLMFLLFYFRKQAGQHKSWENVVMTILIFCAAFSQEQWGLTMVLLTLMLIVCAKLDHSLCIVHFGFLASAIAGAAILFFSPGLWSRAARTDVAPPLLLQIGLNIKKAVGQFFCMDSRLTLIALFLSLFFICGYLRKKDNSKMGRIADLLSMCVYGVLILIYAVRNPVWVTAFSTQDPPTRYLLVVGLTCVITIILTLVQLSRYYLIQKNRMCLVLLYTVFIAIACLSGVNEQPIRLFLPPTLVLFVPITQGICESRNLFTNKRYGQILSAVIVFCVVVTGARNGLQIYRGYAANTSTHVHNDSVFQRAAQDIAQGKTVERIYVTKLPEPIYACDMVYEPGFEFMKSWMCSYYEIPYEVEFVYSDSRLPVTIETR